MRHQYLKLSFALMLALATATGVWARPVQADPDENPAQRESAPRKRQKWFSRQEWFFRQRAYPLNELPRNARHEAYEYVKALRDLEAQQSQALRTATTQWTSIGPSSIPNGHTLDGRGAPVSGRVTVIAIHPANPQFLYIGAAQGGVWKSTNGGQTWTPLTDSQPSLAIGAIAIDPAAPETLYVGTGEPNLSFDSYFGAGILKSKDGGVTWTLLGDSAFQGASISKIVIDPLNTNVLYASSTGGVAGVGSSPPPASPPVGIYKSVDSGMTWTLLRSFGAGVSDLVMDPFSPITLYAAVESQGIYKTTDAGTTWIRVSNGLPFSGYRRISLAIGSPAFHQTLYAGYDAQDAFGSPKGLLFKTTDGGNTWAPLSSAPNYCGRQCFYDNVIAIDQSDANIVYIGGSASSTGFGESLFRSMDGGVTWTDITLGNGTGALHADQHAILVSPFNPAEVYVGNDGGIWKSSNRGGSWTNLNNGLAITQFMSVETHPTLPAIAYGGTQDNGTLKYSGTSSWSEVDPGDGGTILVDPGNPSVVYHLLTRISIARSDDSGQTWTAKTNGISPGERTLFYAPLAMDRAAPSTLYFGTYRLWKTTNKGETWTSFSSDLTKGVSGAGISAIAVAPSSSSVVYAGTSDGRVWVTTTGTGAGLRLVSSNLPNRYVTRIAVDAQSASTAYVTYSGFGSGHVFKTSDGGVSWQDISSNLPDLPVNAIALDPASPGTMYAGTDLGVFKTSDSGTTWSSFNNGMPNVAVFDLHLNSATRILMAATHGRGVFQIALSSTTAVCGDVNGDGLANSTDALLIRQVVVGMRSSADAVFTNFNAGDVNGDGLVNSTDGLFIRQMVVGLRASLPCSTAVAPHR